MLIKFTIFVIFQIVLINCDPSNNIQYCLRDPAQPTIQECLGRQAINLLQDFEDSDNFTISTGGASSNLLMLIKNETVAKRSLVNFLEQDPVDFRGILENAGIVFGQRSLQWNMKNIYPGLQLRVGPTADAGSELEFIMDPEQELDERKYLVEEPSTARILTKRFLLPFLLGFKFKLITLVPIIFAGVIFLCQKAAILAKIALFLTSIFGISLGTAATTGLGFGESFLGGGFGGGFGGFGGGGGSYGHQHHHQQQHHGLGLGGYSSHRDSNNVDFNDAAGNTEPHNFNGYIRNGRKMQHYNNNRPRTQATTESIPSLDKFYDYEKNILLHDRNTKLYEKNDANYFEVPSSDAETTHSRGFVWTDV